jgi:tRNA threonylcarbamoyladenosine biosynthesis protein TsaE
MTWQIVSETSGQTEQLGERLGKALKGGETIELISDLGGGKTTFVKGLAKGAGSHEKVASPSFTIAKEYICPKFTIYHFDFYRLQQPDLVVHELAEVAGDPKVVTVVEWGESVRHVLPPERLTATIKQTSTGERACTFQAPSSLKHLVEAMQ